MEARWLGELYSAFGECRDPNPGLDIHIIKTVMMSLRVACSPPSLEDGQVLPKAKANLCPPTQNP